jgi:TRAP-type C4-dicarboxylate transport system permease small subunit
MCSWQKANIIFDHIINLMAVLAGILMMLTLFLVCGDVGTKLTIGRSLPWVAEIVEYCLLWLTFLGTSWVLKQNSHIRMDMVVDKLKPRHQSVLNAVISFGKVCLIIAHSR